MRDDDSWVGVGHWQDVASGLRMYFTYAIVSVAFAVLLMLVSVAVIASDPGSVVESTVKLTVIGGALGTIIAVFGLVALERYSRISEQTGARGAAKAAFILGVVSVGLSLVSILRVWLAPPDLEAMASVNWLDLFTRLVGVVQVYLFLASMKTCAGYIERFDLHELAGKTTMLLSVTVVLGVLMQLLGLATAIVPMALFGLGMLGIGIWCFVFLLLLVSRLAKAVVRDAHLPDTFS